MEFSTDSYIEMGSSHNICEDYALHGNFCGVFPYIIVCDGCSSSKHTDFGARILAHSCEKELLRAYHGSILTELKDKELRAYLKERILHNSMNVVRNYGMSYEMCDATLMFAYVIENILYYVIYGDGNIVTHHDVINEWHNISFDSNAPLYPSYNMDVLRKSSYLNDNRFGDALVTSRREYFDFMGNNKPEYLQINKMKVTDLSKLNDGCDCGMINLKTSNVKSITLASDGMETYSHNLNRLIEKPSQEEKDAFSTYSMIKKMVSYKNTNGAFVKRRMKKMKQECDKAGVEHFDDVSCATMWINNDKES